MNESMLNRVTLTLLGLSLLALGPAAHAGPPVAGCQDLIESDIVVFAESSPTQKIVGKIDPAATCTDVDGDLLVELHGDVHIEFGPYDPALGCGPDDDLVTVSFNGEELKAGLQSGYGTATYTPNDPNNKFPAGFGPAGWLTTECVSPDNLPYRILDLKINGAFGARTGDPGVGEAPTELQLPVNVRAEDASGFIHTLHLEEHSLAQDMSFTYDHEEGPASPLRFWPDGLPFRLGPWRMTYTERDLSFISSPTFGPTPYAYEPPHWSGVNLGLPVQCGANDPEPGNACTTTPISNAGYLDAAWEPLGAVITQDGLNIDMQLTGAAPVIYEPLFPRETWVSLTPPASISVADSQIVSGTFTSGEAWLRRPQLDECDVAPPADRKFTLHGGTTGPQIGLDGRLLAGIVDLNPPDPTLPQPVEWWAHSATDLGCGTMFIPPLATPDDPQVTWNESHVPTVLDRGIYAGFNYNRNRVCHDSSNATLPQTCTVDTDCDTASGEYCADGGFSPLCPPIDPQQFPTWNTLIDDVPYAFVIDPDAPGQGDREMAFVLRHSGVTGVFDAGDDDFVNNPINGFTIAFDRFGLAYRESQRRGADTIVSADVEFPWPAATQVPIPEMEMCKCGQTRGGRSPDLIKNTLLYWDADFLPYGVNLMNGPAPPNATCADLFANTCDDDTTDPPDIAVIQGVTPIRRIQPDPQSCFSLDTSGVPSAFEPISGPELKFDEALGLQPYRFDIDFFELSTWDGVTSKDDVTNCTPPNCEPYGYYDLSGELEVPYFGSTPAGLKIHPTDQTPQNGVPPEHFPVDLHAKGNLADSWVTATRSIAADSVPVSYKIDYFTPDVTADEDGTDEITINGDVMGQGKLFAFAENQSIGAAEVAGAMVLTPDDGVVHGQADVGPAAALRLWGETEPSAREEKLATIMSSGLLQTPGPGNQYNMAIAQLGFPASDLPSPSELRFHLFDKGAIDQLQGHPLDLIHFEVGDPGLSPPVSGTRVAGFMQFDGAEEQVEFFEVVSDQSTGGEFYAFDASLLQVDRHVKQSGMPITTQGRADVPGASKNMQLPGNQSIPFPSGGGMALGGGGFFPGIQWDYDYDVDHSVTPPAFKFNSLTGTMDLTQGGFSGMGFDELSATLGFYADGDWYFKAAMKIYWGGYGASGGVLLGSTQDMTPLRDLDPAVAGFIKASSFDGAYMRMGVRMSLVSFGCLLRIGMGAEVGGWYLEDSFGGKVRGYVFGEGACLVDVRGDLTLMGAVEHDVFRVQGNFWVAGGIGFCDEEDWDTPADVLDDDFCSACVGRLKVRGRYPPSDLDLTFSGPRISCAL